jgi:hypothetical protein
LRFVIFFEAKLKRTLLLIEAQRQTSIILQKRLNFECLIVQIYCSDLM